jgi:peptidoglycan/LPS O-acetylase OafA/YrhL
VLADHAQPEPGQLPRTVLAAAVVEAIEATGLLLAAILAGIATAAGHSYQTASGIAITLIGVGAAVLLAFVAHGLRRARRWSRTPAMLTQLFAGIVAVYLVQSGRLDWGVPGIVLAVAGVVALLSPASVRLLTPGRIEKR